MKSSLRSALRFVVYLALPVAIWPALSWLHSGAPVGSGVTRLEEAEFLAGSSAVPPTLASGWQRRALPDDWRRSAGDTIDGWYRLRLPETALARGNSAVYLPTAAMNAAVWLNGEPLGDGGSFDEPVARNWNRPLLFHIPDGVVHPGATVLWLRVKADFPGRGFLDRVYVGPSPILEAAWASRWGLRVTAVWGIAVCLVLAGLFNAALWLQWRREEFYGWYAAAAFAWAAIHLEGLLPELPIPALFWYGIWYSAVAWFALLNVLFVLSFIGDGDPVLERRLVGVCGIVSALLVLMGALGSSWLHATGRAAITGVMALSAYSTRRVGVLIGAGRPSARVVVPHLLGTTLVVAGLHDWLWIVGLYGRPYDYYVAYAAPAVLLGMGWALLDRFVGALRQSKALVATLEDRVQESHAELERSYESMRAAEQARVLAEERGRIMRDMHDGLGSHLVSTLALVEREGAHPEEIASTIRSALDDLRLVIDSLEPLDGELLPALGMLRARLQSRLSAAGVAVEWAVEDLPPIEDLGPHKVLRVLRILQQAIANALQKPGIRTIGVHAGIGTSPGGSPAVYVEIGDDAPPNGPVASPEQGMDGMRGRAQEIGAELESGYGTSGSTIRLWIPHGGNLEDTDRPAGRG